MMKRDNLYYIYSYYYYKMCLFIILYRDLILNANKWENDNKYSLYL